MSTINQLFSKVKQDDQFVLDVNSDEVERINNTNFYHSLIKKDNNDSLQKIKKGKGDKSLQSRVLIPIPEHYFDSLPLDNSCVKLDSSNPPTIGCYTILNSHNKMNCCDFTVDGTMIAIGLKDGLINLWVLDSNFPEDISEELIKNLEEYKETHYSKMLKGGEIFYDLCNNNNADDVGEEDKNAYDNVITKRRFYVLNGHSEAVYSISFSPDNKYLVSGSFDESIRLWSTITKQILIVYKGHFSPVLQVKFSPLCHYFASGGCDKTAKIWSISSVTPIRQFAGHLSDVDIIEFHPNGLYLVTSADDKTIRIWCIETGECVRLIHNFSGKNYVDSIGFANSGKIMVVGCDCSLVIYDLVRMGNPIRVVKNFTTSPIYSICLNLEDTYIVASTQEQEIVFFDFDLLLNDQLSIEIDMNSYNNDSRFKYAYSYNTKKTPIVLMKFNNHNILMTLGRFDDNDPKIFM